MKKHTVFTSCLVLFISISLAHANWISLFDGQSFDGWQASENKQAWKIENDCFVTRGARSHLFYMGDVQGHDFKNFELKAQVKTEPGSNSGIFVHTRYQETGWPKQGYECQVINSYPQVEPGKYIERKMTGSIYGVRNAWKAPAPDNEWFDYRIVVQGKTLRTYINDLLICEYTEPADAPNVGRVLAGGTIALQCHDPKSVVRFRNIKIKVLADNLPTPGNPLVDREFDEKLIKWAGKNVPLMDLHVHLKQGLSLEQALTHARQYGYTYGIAVNCGLKMTLPNETALKNFLKTYEKPPHSFLAMQAEGREWLDLFSKESIAKFDYVFTDAMTWTNKNGKRMRLWIPSETEVGDPQDFMEQLVQNIETIFSSEPVDIYVNPTYLPEAIRDRYDELWTQSRMDRVIKVLKENKVALEINARYRIPSPPFLKRAKAAGVQFTFGTNNISPNDLGRMDYCIEMIEACKLTWKDIWVP